MKQILHFGSLALMTVALTGCFDNGYDLDNIDTTSEFKVKDLVLPINLDVVTLGDIIDIKEGDQIKEVTLNGKTFYAVQESGTFSSDPINIPSFSSPAPVISPSVLNFTTATRSGDVKNSSAITLPLKTKIERKVIYSADNIDPAIIEITDLYSDNIGISLTFTEDAAISSLADIELSDITLQLPAGLTIGQIVPAGKYKENGTLTIPSVKFENGKAQVSLSAKAINLPANNSGIDYDSHSLKLEADINIESANLNITPKVSDITQIPSSVSLNVDYALTGLNVSAVTGDINYMLEGNALNISPVHLNEIPDFLAQEGTDLILNNPQIYLSVNNPVANEKLGFQTGLKLTSIRGEDNRKNFSLAEDAIKVGYSGGITGPYNFCLSPEDPEDIPSGFVNPDHIEFSSLGNVISGNGIPQMIEIELVKPQVYRQHVDHFELGRNLDKLEGKWEFLAPLAMKSGSESKIIYTDTKDGWNDEDVDAITIQRLEITTEVTSTLPLEAVITGYPIDKFGNQISNVAIEGAKVNPGAKDEPVTIRITGEVKHLDGITFTAIVKPGPNDEALSPSQTLTLKKVRAKVTGNYTKEL
jgi:lipoprotein